jgi:hypothetical protein
MAGFEGDRGKDLLGGTNVRELVPYFIDQVATSQSSPPCLPRSPSSGRNRLELWSPASALDLKHTQLSCS